MTTRQSPFIWVMTKEYPPVIIGGLGTVAAKLTKALIHAHTKVNIITRSSSRSIRYSRHHGAALLRIPTDERFYNHSTFRPHMILQAATRFFSDKPDVMHVHSLEFAKAAIRYQQQFRIPIVYTCHSLVSGRRSDLHRRQNQNLLIRYADRIVVPSRWLKIVIRRTHAGAASKLSVIPHGVKPAAKSVKAAAPHRLLFVGRLLQNKGIEPLVRSLPSLADNNRHVSLTVIGRGSGGYVRRLRAIARKIGMASRIRWLGYLPYRQVQHFYSAHGAVVVPSRQESFCLVALEAMASGIPLVSTRSGGLKEFVNSRNAQIIASVNSKTISRAVQMMWRDRKKTRRRIVRAKLVARRYSWTKRASQYKSLFARLDTGYHRPRKRGSAK